MTEKVMPMNRFHRFLFAVLTFSALFASGCGKDDPNKVVHKAEKDVEKFLDAWSRGEPPDKFTGTEGTIQGTDPDWKAGYRLLSFLSDDVKQSQDVPDHIRCQVALFLQDAKGNKVDKKVVYDVQVGEKSIISRASP